MVWPRNTSTRCLAQASLIARTVSLDRSRVRSTPLISAPQADDNGVTVTSMTSCIGPILPKETKGLAHHVKLGDRVRAIVCACKIRKGWLAPLAIALDSLGFLGRRVSAWAPRFRVARLSLISEQGAECLRVLRNLDCPTETEPFHDPSEF